jgi:hypothetical protein
MQQLARRLSLVAHRGHDWIERLQAGQPKTSQEAADGGGAAAHDRSNAPNRHAISTESFDALGQGLIDAAARFAGPAAAVKQAWLPLLLEATPPLACTGRADSGSLGRRHQSQQSNAFDQQLATFVGQSGILMAVHPGGFPLGG